MTVRALVARVVSTLGRYSVLLLVPPVAALAWGWFMLLDNWTVVALVIAPLVLVGADAAWRPITVGPSALSTMLPDQQQTLLLNQLNDKWIAAVRRMVEIQ